MHCSLLTQVGHLQNLIYLGGFQLSRIPGRVQPTAGPFLIIDDHPTFRGASYLQILSESDQN